MVVSTSLERVAFTAGLGGLLLGLTLIGDVSLVGPDPRVVVGGLIVGGLVGIVVAIVVGLRRREPFLDVRAFRKPAYAGAALVSLLTGYAFATAIIGAAVVVDRVRYGGPSEQQVVLGALAGATAVGALLSGLIVRRGALGLVTVVGLVMCAAALLLMSRWDPATSVAAMAGALALFGLGFGATVTPRSTAAAEALGSAAFGAAAATVTVARMIGMAIGLAVLTAYGSTTIDRLTAEVYATPDAYQALLPPELVGRPLNDGLVVAALEAWAAGEAARILGGIFLVAMVVTLAAIPAALAMGVRPRILRADRRASEAAREGTRQADPDLREALGDGLGGDGDRDGADPAGRAPEGRGPGPREPDGSGPAERGPSVAL